MNGTGARWLLTLLWLFFICYPDPRLLWRSIQNTVRPPVDPASVGEWAAALPDNPAAIEALVLERVHYAIPWQTFGVPWVLAGPAETLARGFGDCQARAVVLASVLAAKGIPYQLRASIDHMWVEYPGKQPNGLENAAKTLWTQRPTTGGLAFRLPQIDLAESFRIEKEYFWDAAPPARKQLLCAGLAAIWVLPALAPLARRLRDRYA